MAWCLIKHDENFTFIPIFSWREDGSHKKINLDIRSPYKGSNRAPLENKSEVLLLESSCSVADIRFCVRTGICLLATSFLPACGHNQLPIKRVPDVTSPEAMRPNPEDAGAKRWRIYLSHTRRFISNEANRTLMIPPMMA
jgi:hypothetical protein